MAEDALRTAHINPRGDNLTNPTTRHGIGISAAPHARAEEARIRSAGPVFPCMEARSGRQEAPLRGRGGRERGRRGGRVRRLFEAPRRGALRGPRLQPRHPVPRALPQKMAPHEPHMPAVPRRVADPPAACSWWGLPSRGQDPRTTVTASRVVASRPDPRGTRTRRRLTALLVRGRTGRGSACASGRPRRRWRKSWRA